MTEPPFELHLQRLFADVAPRPDAAAFTARVQRRLDRGWALRRLVIGVAGASGGLLAAAQFLASGLLGRASAASGDAALRVRSTAAALLHRAEAAAAAHAPPLGGEALWLAAGLAGVGVALLAARLFEAF